MTLIAFKGATMWEWQIGRLYGGFLLPKMWCRRNLPLLVRIGWDRSGQETDA